jgi:hypothetical protein
MKQAFFVLMASVLALFSGERAAHAACGITLDPPSAVGSPADLPDATVATPYSFTLTASGGSGDYFWQQVGGSLPAGLAIGLGHRLTSSITGTPTTISNGTQFSLTMVVYDNANFNCSTTGVYNLALEAAAPDAGADASPDAAIADAAAPDAALPDATVPDASVDASVDATTVDDAGADAEADASTDDAAVDAAADALACAALSQACPPSCCAGLSCELGVCCADQGAACTNDTDCCGSTAACLLGHCALVDSADAGCQPAGGLCHVDGDCCSGTVCSLGTCQDLSDTSAVCAALGEDCSATGKPCCDGTKCANGKCCGTYEGDNGQVRGTPVGDASQCCEGRALSEDPNAPVSVLRCAPPAPYYYPPRTTCNVPVVGAIDGGGGGIFLVLGTLVAVRFRRRKRAR